MGRATLLVTAADAILGTHRVRSPVRDGEPADLIRITDYPVTAVCKVCGQPIRTERWLLSEWRHIAPEH